jgi:hypothetical protein
MAAWSSGHEAIVAIKTYKDRTELKQGERIPSGPCCWHCHYYIRPAEGFMIDGPVTTICTIDRQKGIYPNPMYLSPGDRPREPEECCDRFEKQAEGTDKLT